MAETKDLTPPKITEKVTMREIRLGRTILHKKVSCIYPKAIQNKDPSSAVNILFVHGSCAGSEQYGLLVSSLYEHFSQNFTPQHENEIHQSNLELNCYLFDALGCGSSKHNVNDWHAFSEAELAKDLETIFLLMNKESKVDTKTYIIAHSYGTSQVIKLINTLNEKEDISPVDGIILIGSTIRDGPVPMDKGLFIFRLPVFFLKWIQSSLTDAFVNAAYHPESDNELKEQARTFSNQNNMAFVKAFYRQTKTAGSEDAKKVKTKALVVHGENDMIIPLANGEFLARCLPQSKFVVVPKTSHQVFEEKPKYIAQLVYDFIWEK